MLAHAEPGRSCTMAWPVGGGRLIRKRPIVIILLAAGLAACQPSAVVISEPGEHSLEAPSGPLRIATDDIVIDLGGHGIRCEAEQFGIDATGRERVVIRNGTISGCVIGVNATDSRMVTIEAVDFTGVRKTGVQGSEKTTGLTVRDSVFADIAGYDSQAYAIGIKQTGSDCLAERNVFRNIRRQSGAHPELVGDGVAIVVNMESTGCVIRENLFVNDGPSEPPEIGIWVGAGASATIDGNNIVDFARGIAAYPDATVTIRDNGFKLSKPQADSYAIGAQKGEASGNTIAGYDKAIKGRIGARDNAVAQ